MIIAGVLLSLGRRLIYSRPCIALWFSGKSLSAVRNRDVFMNIQSSLKWWPTLKSAVIGSIDHNNLLFLVGVVNWWVRHSLRLILCQIILAGSSSGVC